MTSSNSSISSQDSPNKHVIVVLGMGRSGTSAITRGLKTLGISLGGKHLTPGDWNPKGFWEDKDIVVKVNEKLLPKLGFTWQSIGDITLEQSNPHTLQKFLNKASELLRQRFKETNYWAFKDPRTCRLLPFWQQVFTQLNLTDHYIIVLRNPLSALESFAQKSYKVNQQGLLVWLANMIPTINVTRGKKRIVVEYELMMQDPRKQLERIKQALTIPFAIDTAEMEEYTQQFLDKKLTHYKHTYEQLKSNPNTPPICLQAYEWFCKLARDETTFVDKEFMAAWNNIQAEFNSAYVPLYADSQALQRFRRSILYPPAKFIAKCYTRGLALIKSVTIQKK